MSLWIVLSLLLTLAMLILAWPFLRRYRRAETTDPRDVALYREQLDEVEHEVARGFLSRSEADETRRDIERRALAAVKRSGDGNMGQSVDKVRMIGLSVTLAWMAVGSAILYFAVGRPDLAAIQTADRLMASVAPVTPPRTRPAVDPTPPPSRVLPTSEPLADVETMIGQLARRLAADPGDLAGWKMLGWSRLSTQDFDGAVEAYSRASDLAPQDDEVLSLQGEAVVRAAGGRVTPTAQAIFARALALNPQNPRAAFFAGMALDQSGKPAQAVERWLDLYDDAPPDADFLPGLETRIREVSAREGIDLGDRLDRSDLARRPLRNPSEAEIAAARQMTTEDRQQMIRGMVDGLAARLADKPDDPDGWARLIRAYTVLENREAASQALATAREVFAQDSDTLFRINGLAAELELR